MTSIQAGRDLEKLVAVFDSCETAHHVRIAKRMAECYHEKYRDRLDIITAAYATNRITGALNRATYRIGTHES